MRNKTEIIRSIIDKPEGGTWGTLSRHLPDYGYFVGGAGEAFVAESASEMRQDRFRTWLDKVTTPFVGWWTDSETGKLYVDAVTWYEDEYPAAAAGLARGEIAIYDIQRQRDLRLVHVPAETGDCPVDCTCIFCIPGA